MVASLVLALALVASLYETTFVEAAKRQGGGINRVNQGASTSNAKPALSFTSASGVVQFSQSDSRTSREAYYDVWIKGGKVYKFFSQERQATEPQQRTEAAIRAGVPTPPIQVKL